MDQLAARGNLSSSTPNAEQGADLRNWAEILLEEALTGAQEDRDESECDACFRPTESCLKCVNDHLLCVQCLEAEASKATEKAQPMMCPVIDCLAGILNKRLKLYKHRHIINEYLKNLQQQQEPLKHGQATEVREGMRPQEPQHSDQPQQPQEPQQSDPVGRSKESSVLQCQAVFAEMAGAVTHTHLSERDTTPLVGSYGEAQVGEQEATPVSKDQKAKLDKKGRVCRQQKKRFDRTAAENSSRDEHDVWSADQQEQPELEEPSELGVWFSADCGSLENQLVVPSRSDTSLTSLQFDELNLLRALYAKTSPSKIMKMQKISNPICRQHFKRLAQEQPDDVTVEYISSSESTWLESIINEGLHVCPADGSCPHVFEAIRSPSASIVETTRAPVVVILRLPSTTGGAPLLRLPLVDGTHVIDLSFCPAYLVHVCP